MLSPHAAQAKRIRRASTTGVLALAVAGFTLSYEALHRLAVEHGVPPHLAWAWPLIVDGFIVVASLAVVHAVLEGRRTAYPWALVLGFSTMLVAFNVLHAPPSPVARLVAAVPRLALVLSFELLMRQVRAALATDTEPQTGIEQAAQTALVARPLLTPAPAPRRRRPRTADDTRQRARHLVDTYRRRGERVTGAALAQELGVSEGYGRRLLRQLDDGPTEAAAS